MATPVSLRWVRSPDFMIREVQVRKDGMVQECDSGFQDLAGKAQDWMKANAPWNDRTGDARAGLKAEFEKGGDTYNIRFSHNVYYGIFLERGFNHTNGNFVGPYPIIEPAIRKHSETARAVMRRAVGKVTGG